MDRPAICASIVENDSQAIGHVADIVDLFELRIDLIGKTWRELVPYLTKPWIACNRKLEEGGGWKQNEMERLHALEEAADLGADIIDIELSTQNLNEVVSRLKGNAACLVSYHNFAGTPSLDELKNIVREQLQAGADICKVVTKAQTFTDNLTVLQLIAGFPGVRVVSFAMGSPGAVSRVLCPLVGGDFTYASVAGGKEAASGQITAAELRRIYTMVKT